MKLSSRISVLLALGLTSKVMALGKLKTCNKGDPTNSTNNEIITLSEDACSTDYVKYCITENDEIVQYGWVDGKCVITNNPTEIPKSTNGYLFFESNGGLLIQSGTVDSGYQCSSIEPGTITGCVAMDDIGLDQNKYYINAAADTLAAALVNYGSTSSIEDGKNGSYYPSGGANSLIKCENDQCTIVGDVTSGSYYLSTIVGYIIKCSNNGCENVPVTSEAYFLNGAYKANTTGSGPSSQLIYCNGSQCEYLTTNSGYYVNEDNKKLIDCNSGTCISKPTDVGNFYLSTNPNILIDCTDGVCENVQAKIGIYRLSNESNKFIKCDTSGCNELSPSECDKIPVCDIQNNKCMVRSGDGSNSEASVLLPEGAYCKNGSGDILYFATNTIELDNSIVVTTASNCIQASQTYFQYYYTVGPTIYHVDDGEVTQITAPGYYFINTSTNKLVTGSKIEDYNDPFVKLYKCNGASCVVIPNPSTTTYIVDVSKRIFKYTGNAYTFAYDKDVLCNYSNNKCVPQTDLKNTEFCVTSSGELVIAAGDIEAKKTGECYKSSTINNEIFGYSTNLYKLNLYDATLIDNTGYFLVSMNTNSTTELKEFSNKNSDIVLYGCSLSSCSLRTPEEGVYYYDNVSKYLVRYDTASSQWVFPTDDGYAFISTEPGERYVRKFTVDSSNKVTISDRVSDGYYYTTDNEMYECPSNEGNSCELIDESMYVMTNDNELFYCNVDDDNLTLTVCNKQSCVLGELYYIGGYHFRCVTGNVFNILSTKYCNNDELVVVNFPTAFSETYPSNVKNAVDEISKNNNNTATVKAGSNHLTVIPGIFTNCTYDKEEKMATFDLVCIENYVVLDNEKEPQICSTSKLGFVGCNEDSENPDKCNPSSAMTIFLSKVAIAFAMVFLGFMLY